MHLSAQIKIIFSFRCVFLKITIRPINYIKTGLKTGAVALFDGPLVTIGFTSC